MGSKCKTTFIENAVECNESKSLFMILRDVIQWQDGIRSRKGFTRKAKPIAPNSLPLVSETIKNVLKKLNKENYIIDHIYLNYYETGDMWTPNHSHKGTHQLVISLGGTRTLNVAKKDFKMKSGDAILFGSSIHGVPKEPNSEPRISIATFMKPLSL